MCGILGDTGDEVHSTRAWQSRVCDIILVGTTAVFLPHTPTGVTVTRRFSPRRAATIIKTRKKMVPDMICGEYPHEVLHVSSTKKLDQTLEKNKNSTKYEKIM